jgi:hypothetical protein
MGQQIFVTLPDTSTLPLDTESSDTILGVKQKILDQTGIPVNQQQLTFDNIVLSDSSTLSDYNIQKNSTLVLTLVSVASVANLGLILNSGFTIGPGVVLDAGYTPPPGPTIVTDGLVLHYDFSDPTCYSGGVTVNDLSTANNEGSVVNAYSHISYVSSGTNSYFNWDSNSGGSDANSFGSSIWTTSTNVY